MRDDKKIIKFEYLSPIEMESLRLKKLLDHCNQCEIERALDVLDKNGIKYELRNYKRKEKNETNPSN